MPRRLVKKLAYEHTTHADPKYLAQVEKAIVDAVARRTGRVEVKAGIGKGIEDRVAFNRRFRMRTA